MIYHIFANRSNIGDWLSAKGIQKLLAPLSVQECLCDRPFVKQTMTVLENATEKDLIIIGGGGLLMDYFTPFWEAFKSIAKRIPFVIWGVGYCDLKYEDTLPPGKLVKEVLSNSKLCILRDQLSREISGLPDLPPPVPCPAINFLEFSSEKGSGILHVNNYTTAGVPAYEAMCNDAKKMALKTGRIYRETNNRIEPDSEVEMAGILSMYQQSDLVISSALHGCIIAVAMGRKILAVSGDRKIDGFMEAVGLSDWVIDTMDTHLIFDKLEKLPEQNYPLEKINEILDKNRQVAEIVKTF